VTLCHPLQSTIGGKFATDYPEVNLPQGMAAARGSKHPSKGGSKHPSKKRLSGALTVPNRTDGNTSARELLRYGLDLLSTVR